MIEVAEQIQAAHRRIAAHNDDRGEVRCVIVSRTYDASLSEVWDACTNAKRIARWFLPVTGDLRSGGRYQLEGNAGGTINRCDSATGFSASWEFGGEITWIELSLAPNEGDTTLLELIHIVPADEKWAKFGPGTVGLGWDLALIGLAAHLASTDGERGIPPTWAEGDEGIHSIRLSSEQWHQANLAAGAKPDDAHAAAERTTAFGSRPLLTPLLMSENALTSGPLRLEEDRSAEFILTTEPPAESRPTSRLEGRSSDFGLPTIPRRRCVDRWNLGCHERTPSRTTCHPRRSTGMGDSGRRWRRSAGWASQVEAGAGAREIRLIGCLRVSRTAFSRLSWR